MQAKIQALLNQNDMLQHHQTVAHYCMVHALAHANQAHISYPNPHVGCAIAYRNTRDIVALGRSEHQGGRHAEIVALDAAKLQGIDLSACTLYVTLEPCSHQGLTPPCAHAIVASGISEVCILLADPNPQVAGAGHAYLVANHIPVFYLNELTSTEASTQTLTEALTEIAEYGMRGFLKHHRQHMPWVRLKIASSMDGYMCLNNGISKWLTGEKARLHSHYLRARAGAIVTGFNTIRNDDPMLNVRIPQAGRHLPKRWVLDTQGHLINPEFHQTHKDLNIYQTPIGSDGNGDVNDNSNSNLLAHCLHLTKLDATAKPSTTMPAARIPIHAVAMDASVKNNISLPAVLNYAYTQGVQELHIEAGPRLIQAFLEQALFDEIAWYQAPILLGKNQGMDNGRHFAPQQLCSDNLDTLSRLKLYEAYAIGQDVYMNYLK